MSVKEFVVDEDGGRLDSFLAEKLARYSRSFVQGLIAAFAGYYINIYSPYSGRVVCDHSPSEEPYSPARTKPVKPRRAPDKGRL